MNGRTFEHVSIKIVFIDQEDVLTKSVNWKGEDWDDILNEESNLFGGN